MLNRFAIIFIVSLFVFSTTVIAGPTDKTKKKVQPNVQTTSIKSPRDISSGQRTSGKQSAQRNTGLIDTSTGEIVWVDERGSGSMKGKARRSFTGSDDELGALVAW